MDFFQHQDVARRRTTQLVVLFVLAVITITVMIYGVLLLAFGFSGQFSDTRTYMGSPTAQAPASPGWEDLFIPELLLGTAVGVLLVVGTGSLYKTAQLSGGGDVVASALGGRLVTRDTSDPDEKKLLNVVEEMAIASGMSVPPVYVMDQEGGINAFAAGWSPADAVIGVTRGSIEQLTRDELQGVMAHEFSHILNGDMRLNIRLIGIVHGILVIGLIGFHVMRTAAYSAGRRSSSRKGDGGGLALVGVGLAIMVIGFAGTFFGRLIKAAVSRQREFLADAAAVQFTRNPDGIAGALKKIGGYTHGSSLVSPRSEEMSHMFFGQGTSLSLLFSTHPPLPDRIRRIQPGWNGEFVKVTESARQRAKRQAKLAQLEGRPRRGPQGLPAGAMGAAAGLADASFADRIALARQGNLPPGLPPLQAAVDRVGNPTLDDVAHAASLLERIPERIRDLTSEPHGAQAAVFGLLLDRDDQARRQQLDGLAQTADPQAVKLVRATAKPFESLDGACRIPLLDLALPTLRRLSRDDYSRFRTNVEGLIRTDGRVNLFEWALRRIVLHHLDPHFGLAARPKVKHSSLRPLRDHLSALLSTLAHAGHTDEGAARYAFDEGVKQLGLADLPFLDRSACGLAPVDQALHVLAEATPGIKKRVIGACAACIVTDAQVTIVEAELLRAIGDSLDCPMPPLLPSQPLG